MQKKKPDNKPDAAPCCDTEVPRRLVRIESKLAQLMLHVGMSSDGRKDLQPVSKVKP